MPAENMTSVVIDEQTKNVDKLKESNNKGNNNGVAGNTDGKKTPLNNGVKDVAKDSSPSDCAVKEENSSKSVEKNSSANNKADDGITEEEEVKTRQDDDNDDEKRAELEKSAYNLLAEGNKNMLLKNYTDSATLLGKACEQFVELYGELSPKCAQVYYSYGCACLLLGQEEVTLLGAGGGGTTENAKEEAAEKVDKESIAGGSSSSSGVIKSKNKHEKEYEDDDDEDDDHDDDDDESAEDRGASDQEETVENDDDDGDREENLDADDDADDDNEITDEEYNFQLAWESLECARKIFLDLNDENKLADCYLKLGEVSVMTGNYEAAIADMNVALEMRRASLLPDSRIIAEIYFNLALAYNLDNQFDEAIKHLEMSRDVLRLRISNVQKSIVDVSNNDDAAAKEIEDMEAILQNIEEKFVEFNTGKEAKIRNLSELLNADDPPAVGGACSSSSSSGQPAKDISHLVRKKVLKRKSSAVEEEQTVEHQSKKLCANDSSVEKL